MTGRSTFDTVRIVGGLLPSGLVERVGRQEASLEAVAPTDYYLAPGERLGEAITRSWNRLRTLWERFSEKIDETVHMTGPTRQEWLLPLFQELGFGNLAAAPGFEVSGKPYPISHLWESTPIHLVGVGLELDRRTPGAAGAASASPHGLMQEFLNRSDDFLWGIVSNGRQLRVLRDNASLTRIAYVEFDLREMFDGEVFSDFTLLWLVGHASRLEGPSGKQVLERWREDAARQGVRALDALRDGVEAAIVTLGTALVGHPANGELRRRLEERTLEAQELYRQILRVVYRLLFLLVAEGRGLLLDPKADPTARLRYQRYYSVTRLRDVSETTRGSPHTDLWTQLGLIARALEFRGEPALGLLPLGGFLWSDEATNALNDSHLPNEAVLAAIRGLTTVRPTGDLMQRVDYNNLGAEELGSIYESLLEYVPQVNLVAGTFELVGAAGNERKTTGSYYTPTSLIEELLNSALDPVLEEAASKPDPERAVLDLKVVDPAAGSGHFLIAAAHRIANRLARIRADGDEPSPDQLRTALRDVVAHCIYAVDINPMAVELAKVALWIEAMEPGKPLTFLDHHIVCGNSLLGVTPRLLEGGIPDDAFAVLTGDDKEHVKALKKRNKEEHKKRLVAFTFGDSPEELLGRAADEIATIDDLTDHSIEAIAEKQARFVDYLESPERRQLCLAADAWVAAFVGPKTKESLQITTSVLNAALTDPMSMDSDLSNDITTIAANLRFHHWHLAFPDVFVADRSDADDRTGNSGGFEVVIGNPPWEMIQYDPQEAFAVSNPEIADAPTMAIRNQLIAGLEKKDASRYESHLIDLRGVEAVQHFVHSSGRYPLTSFGRLSTAPLFAEMAIQSIAPSGRVGLVVPTGIATDSFNQRFFADLVDRKSLVSLFGFYDRKQIFQSADVHGFCVLTLSGRETETTAPEFVFFARSIAEMHESDRRFRLESDDFRLLNPNTRTCPIFRTRRDAEITKGVYRRLPILVDESGEVDNPWGVTFQLMFMMNTASHLFRTSEQLTAEGWTLLDNTFHRGGQRYLPLYEAKMIHQFNHRWATYDGIDVRSTTLEELQEASFVVLPRYWVGEWEVFPKLREGGAKWLLGFRDIARSTDERTMIASALPVTAVGHKLPLIGVETMAPTFLAALCSFAFDYVARQKTGGTSMTFFIVKQLALPSPDQFERDSPWSDGTVAGWLAPRILELTFTASELAGFAADVGYFESPFRWDPERRKLLRAELDAAFFNLYGIQRDDVDYIMETFPVVKRRDMAEYGSYRTKELILDVYDQMAKAIETGDSYQTILEPPAADPSLRHPIDVEA